MKIRDSFRMHRKTYSLIAGILLVVVTAFATWLKLNGPLKSFDQGPPVYTQYNNYIIFKTAHQHLVQDKNLYVLYPDKHHDLYKYSPSFALIFGLFAYLPDVPGLMFWNLLNVLVFFLVLNRASAPWVLKFPLLFVFLLPELVTSAQNCQSNALMTGLLVLTYLDLEEGKTGRAACWTALATFIKIYAGLGALMFLFYPRKMQFLGTGLLAGLVLAFLPIWVTTPQWLWIQYQSWWQLLSQDHDGSYGISMMQLVNLILPGIPLKTFIQALGLIVLIVLAFPLDKLKPGRLLYFSLILLTLVIFNHKTESATFIVAVSGIGVWYFSKNSPGRFDLFALWFVFLFTVLSATDVFPPFIRQRWIVPYAVKIWPCILVYFMLCYEMYRSNRALNPSIERKP